MFIAPLILINTLPRYFLNRLVDTSEAGRGTLHVALRAANQNVKHNVQNLGNGLLKVIYFPKLAIPHRVDLRYSGVYASGM